MTQLEKLQAVPTDRAYILHVGRNLVDVRCSAHTNNFGRSGDRSMLGGNFGAESVEMMDGIAMMRRHNLRWHKNAVQS